jgi:hypothetical protein
MTNFNVKKLHDALSLLNDLMANLSEEHCGIVVCGGSALIATGLVDRTTKDVDILALMGEQLLDAQVLPPYLVEAAKKTAKAMNLPENWFNSGPAELFRMGLPVGFSERLIKREIGKSLTVYYISRIDQIHFKLYASVDRGGYHIDDLLKLTPTEEELIQAGRWSRTHDVSEAYAELLRILLKELGYADASERV